LTSPLRDDARQAWQRRHVRELIERQEKPSAFLVPVVGGVDELFDESNHERDGDGLVSTGRHDVQLVRATKECFNVQRRFARRSARGFGSNAGEKSRGRRPDA
jgi:hypothetical protein